MRGLFHSKTRRTAGTVMAAVSSLLMLACASQRASTTVAPQRPPVQKKVLAARVLKAKMPELSSMWEGGHCSFKDNSVSYHSYASGETKTLRLDVKVKGSSRLLCSGDFTVLLGAGTAFVAIGGLPILDGREWFGRLGKRFTWANSYEVDFPEGAESRMASLVGNTLHMVGGKKSWSIDLSNPFRGWETY